MTQAIIQLKFGIAIVHKDVQPGLACTTRPDIDNVFDVLEEESLFRLTEGNHVALDKHKSLAMANIRKCHQPNVLQEAASRCICGSAFYPQICLHLDWNNNRDEYK